MQTVFQVVVYALFAAASALALTSTLVVLTYDAAWNASIASPTVS